MDPHRRFLGAIPPHFSESEVIDAIVVHAGVRPQRVLIRNGTGESNSCFGIVRFQSSQHASQFSEVGMQWPNGQLSPIRP